MAVKEIIPIKIEICGQLQGKNSKIDNVKLKIHKQNLKIT